MRVSPVEESAARAVIGGKRKVVIHLKHGGTHRFAVLRRKIPGVSERMLTQQLREFEDDGIVHREFYAEVTAQGRVFVDRLRQDPTPDHRGHVLVGPAARQADQGDEVTPGDTVVAWTPQHFVRFIRR